MHAATWDMEALLHARQVVKAAKRLEAVDTCVLKARFPADSAACGTAPGDYLLMAQRPKAGLLGGAPPICLHALHRHTMLGMLPRMFGMGGTLCWRLTSLKAGVKAYCAHRQKKCAFPGHTYKLQKDRALAEGWATCIPVLSWHAVSCPAQQSLVSGQACRPPGVALAACGPGRCAISWWKTVSCPAQQSILIGHACRPVGIPLAACGQGRKPRGARHGAGLIPGAPGGVLGRAHGLPASRL